MKRNWFLHGLTAFVLIALGCTKPAPRSGSSALMPYELRWSTSGGFTGGGAGYILYGDGRLARWQQATFSAAVDTQFVGTAPAEACVAVRQMIEEKDLLNYVLRASGNMTTTLSISSGGKDHAISWAGWPGEAPKELASLMARLQAIVQPYEK